MKYSHDYTFNNPTTIGGAVQERIKDSPDWYAGSLEALEARVAELTRIVGILVDAMPESEHSRIAHALGLYVREE